MLTTGTNWCKRNDFTRQNLCNTDSQKLEDGFSESGERTPEDFSSVLFSPKDEGFQRTRVSIDHPHRNKNSTQYIETQSLLSDSHPCRTALRLPITASLQQDSNEHLLIEVSSLRIQVEQKTHETLWLAEAWRSSNEVREQRASRAIFEIASRIFSLEEALQKAEKQISQTLEEHHRSTVLLEDKEKEVNALSSNYNDAIEQNQKLSSNLQILKNRLFEVDSELHHTRRQLNHERRARQKSQREAKEDTSSVCTGNVVAYGKEASSSQLHFEDKAQQASQEHRSAQPQVAGFLASRNNSRHNNQGIVSDGNECIVCPSCRYSLSVTTTHDAPPMSEALSGFSSSEIDLLESRLLEQSERLGVVELENLKLKELLKTTALDDGRKISTLENRLLREAKLNELAVKRQWTLLQKELRNTQNMKKMKRIHIARSSEVEVTVISKFKHPIITTDKSLQTDFNYSYFFKVLSCIKINYPSILERSTSMFSESPEDGDHSYRTPSTTQLSLKTPFPIPTKPLQLLNNRSETPFRRTLLPSRTPSSQGGTTEATSFRRSGEMLPLPRVYPTQQRGLSISAGTTPTRNLSPFMVSQPKNSIYRQPLPRLDSTWRDPGLYSNRPIKSTLSSISSSTAALQRLTPLSISHPMEGSAGFDPVNYTSHLRTPKLSLHSRSASQPTGASSNFYKRLNLSDLNSVFLSKSSGHLQRTPRATLCDRRMSLETRWSEIINPTEYWSGKDSGRGDMDGEIDSNGARYRKGMDRLSLIQSQPANFIRDTESSVARRTYYISNNYLQDFAQNHHSRQPKEPLARKIALSRTARETLDENPFKSTKLMDTKRSKRSMKQQISRNSQSVNAYEFSGGSSSNSNSSSSSESGFPRKQVPFSQVLKDAQILARSKLQY